MNSRVVLAAAAMAIAGCATAPVNEGPAASEMAGEAQRPIASSGLEFAVEPAAAEIYIDGQSRGTVAGLAATRGILLLPPGIYQVSLKAAGRVTWRAEVAVGSARERIAVKLVPKS